MEYFFNLIQTQHNLTGGTTMLVNVVCSFILTAILIATPKTEAECTCPSTGCPNRGSEG